jgi:hypothetical protein
MNERFALKRKPHNDKCGFCAMNAADMNDYVNADAGVRDVAKACSPSASVRYPS